ncbi:hypothetical protein J5N97_024443 [Dioscorea zingiberensis]|uniref:FAD-binding domain-containing protein n=1 Tax=Dioscorea zingiberensis TaxID=325984 RepID=A0A9D5C6E2_9LILI|nr:hypothetical protein J5N97_024443 [Dioscorea zingiberensis]
MTEEVVIVGAGIAGLATALALERVGLRSVVLERAQDLRTTGAALTLFPNAWRALDALGVAHKLTPFYQPLQKGTVMNVSTGVCQEISFSAVTDSEGMMGVRCVHRKFLLEVLAEELPPGTIRFSSKLVSIKTETLDDSSLVYLLHLDDGTIIKTKRLIGCDGVHSVVAQWLGLTKPIDSGRRAVRGLSVFPEGHGFPSEAQQFIGNGKRGAFLPVNDKEVYWFITLSSKLELISSTKKEEMDRDPEVIKREVMCHLAKDFPADYLNVVNHSELSTLSLAPLMFRLPWDLIFGCTNNGGVTVAGDAFHPMTPDLGQGGCAALEDAVVLVRNIVNSQDNVAEGIKQYVFERRWRVMSLIIKAYVSGFIQQDHSTTWWSAVKFFRDNIFYRFAYSKMFEVMKFDCGVLPIVKNE